MDLLHALQEAIGIAKRTFPELKDVERQRISLTVHVGFENQLPGPGMIMDIGRKAWPTLLLSLDNFQVVKIRVTPPLVPETGSAEASSSSQASAVEPRPYTPEKSGFSQPPSPPSFVTRMINRFTPKSSRSRPFSQ